MRRYILITIIVVFLGELFIVASLRRRQVWIGHEKIHEWSVSYAGELPSLEACRREVQKYGGYCSSRCTWVDNVRRDNCKRTVTIAAKLPH